MAKARSEIDPNGRNCTVCNEFKNWDHFHIDNSSRSGHVHLCKICARDITKIKEPDLETPINLFLRGMYGNHTA